MDLDLVKLVIEAIASVIFKEAAERSIKEILKRKSERKTPLIKKYQKKLLDKNKKFILKGDLGEDLFNAFAKFIETKDLSKIDEFLKKAPSDKDVALLLEISRPVEMAFRLQMKRPAEYIISSIGELSPSQFPIVAEATNRFISMINAVHRGPKIHLVLSTPIPLAFQTGQFVGLSHYDVNLYHFQKGKYISVPKIKR